jgi:DNA sulfur modification protein DndC
MGDNMDWVHDDLGTFGVEESQLIEEVCKEHGVRKKLVQRLLDIEFQHYGMKRRASIYSELNKVLSEDWRPTEEIVAELEGKDRVEAWVYPGMED